VKTISLAFVTVALGLMVTPQIQAARYKDMFNVRGNTLYKDANPVVFKGIAFPALGDPASTYVDFMKAAHGTARVGGNGIAFTLHGLSPDGASIDATAVKRAKFLAKELKDRHMAAILRVFPPDFAADYETRERAARTVADAFRGEVKLIYWVDGPESERVAPRLNWFARELVVAAEEGGEVDVVSEVPTKARNPILLLNAIPGEGNEKVSYLLEDLPASYEAIEAATADPAELQPWTPDNSVVSEQERNEGFIALFNGRDLEGWYIVGSNKKGFEVKDGNIEWVAKGASALRTVRRYNNFVLRLEYRIEDGGNSGVHLRAPRGGRASRIGFEAQIMGDHGKKPVKDSTGSIYDQIPPRVNANLAPWEWNSYEIICDGPHVKITLNGYVVQDLNFDDKEELKYRLREGFIHLTDHGNKVSYRNIRLKPL
jgi:hypothetical protein